MADALLVAEQSIGSLAIKNSSWEVEPRSNYFNSRQVNAGLSPSALMGLTINETAIDWRNLARNPTRSSSVPPVSASPNRRSLSARHALEQIAARQKPLQGVQQFRDEMDWLSKNRDRFSNVWVALLGSKLLAMGGSAKEVFEATKGKSPTPLIVHIEGNAESLPFAGW